MGARVVGQGVAQSRHDKAAVSHAARDDTIVALASPDSALAGYPDPPSTVLLLLREVVVTVDPLYLATLTHKGEQGLQGGIHHDLPVLQGVGLDPQHIANVGLEGRVSFKK